MTHDCVIEGCTADVPMHQLMCRGHWAQVPREIQRDVYAAWRDRRAGKHGARARHLQACEDAQAAVEGREPVELFA